MPFAARKKERGILKYHEWEREGNRNFWLLSAPLTVRDLTHLIENRKIVENYSYKIQKAALIQ